METAKSKGVTIHLPTDFVCGSKFGNDAEVTMGNLKDGVPVGYMVSLFDWFCLFQIKQDCLFLGDMVVLFERVCRTFFLFEHHFIRSFFCLEKHVFCYFESIKLPISIRNLFDTCLSNICKDTIFAHLEDENYKTFSVVGPNIGCLRDSPPIVTNWSYVIFKVL